MGLRKPGSLTKDVGRKEKNRGSASIEASIAVIFLVLISLFFFQICELAVVDSVVYEAAAETAEYMAEYSYLAEHFQGAEALEYPVAGLKFISYVDDADLLEKYVTGGVYGVTVLGSQLPAEDGVIELRYTYRVSLDIPILCNLSAVRTGVIKQNAYLGGGRDKSAGTHETSEKVYIADGSEVYHRDCNCTYLRPSVIKTDLQDAKTKGLTKCRYCGKVEGDTVYITEYGEVYHSTDKCSRIKRNVKEVDLDGISLPPCSKCGH